MTQTQAVLPTCDFSMNFCNFPSAIYAVENGVHVISLSHRAVESKSRAVLDQAIEKTAGQSVVFAYINYKGKRNEVLAPSPMEFDGTGNKPSASQ
jgi:hypothetical protein